MSKCHIVRNHMLRLIYIFSHIVPLVDGGWGTWGRWQPCSTTCGEGIKERTRECDNPPPVHRGAYCDDSGVERQRCKLQECPGERIVPV